MTVKNPAGVMIEMNVNPAQRRDAHHPPGFTAAYAGIFLFVAIYYWRPNDWIPGVTAIPFAKFAGIIAGAGFLITLLTQPSAVWSELRRIKALGWLLLLYTYMWLCLPFAYWRGGTFEILANQFSEVILVAALMMVTVTSVRRLKLLLRISIFAAAVASAFAVHSYLLLGSDGRIVGIFKNVFSNPNDLALNVVILVPFCGALVMLTRGISRLFWIVCCALMLAGVIVSFSRAGFLALMTICLMIVFSSKKHRMVAFAFIILGCMTIWIAAPGQFGSRIATITNPDADSTGSAQAREQLLIESLRQTLKHPITGLGAGNFDSVSQSWHGTHNIFTQWSSECGIPALLLFLLMLRATFRATRSALSRADLPRDLAVLTRASQISVVALLVGAFFYHCAFQFFTYFPIAYAVALGLIAERIPQGEASPQAKPTGTPAELLAIAYQ